MPSEIRNFHFALSANVVWRWCARLLPAFLIAVSGRATHAQPAAGPLVLRLPASARLLAMGNAGLASNDADALFYNPALLINARGMALSMQRYGSFGTAGSLANVVVVGTLNIGVGAQVLNWSAQPLSYRETMRKGSTALADSGVLDASSTAITLGVARTVRGRRVGVNVKYAEDRFPGARDGTVAFDVGVMGPSFARGTFSISVQDIGPGLRLGGEEGILPTRLNVGWGGMISSSEIFDIGVQTQLTVARDGFVSPAGGAEIAYVPIEGVALVARAGLRLPREDKEGFATGGLGFTVDRISLDYAIEHFRGGVSVSHRLGLRIK